MTRSASEGCIVRLCDWVLTDNLPGWSANFALLCPIIGHSRPQGLVTVRHESQDSRNAPVWLCRHKSWMSPNPAHSRLKSSTMMLVSEFCRLFDENDLRRSL